MTTAKVLAASPPALAALRREWAMVAVAGMVALLVPGMWNPWWLVGAASMWGYVSWLLFRGLEENHLASGAGLLSSLGPPTFVTMGRGLLLAGVAGFVLVAPPGEAGWAWAPALAYTGAALLDHVDGRLARAMGRSTPMGSRLDMEIDAAGILVAATLGVLYSKLPPWYLGIGLARYGFVLGLSSRRLSGLEVGELSPSSARRVLAGVQMGFLAAALWPWMPAEVSWSAAYVFGAATLTMFVRDWLSVTGRLRKASASLAGARRAEAGRLDRGQVLRTCLWLAAVGILVWALRDVSLTRVLQVTGALGPSAVAALVVVNLGALVVFTLRWWVVLRGLGASIALAKASLYRLSAFGFAYFTPGPQVGGEPVQVLLAERRHGLSREVAIASVALDRVLELVVNFGFLAAAALYLLGDAGVVFFVGMLVSVPVLYLVALARDGTPVFRLLRVGARVWSGERYRSACEIARTSEETAGRFCRERPRHLDLALAFSIASWAIMLFEYWLMAALLGMPLGLDDVVLGLTAARVALLLFLPAGLGVFEAGQIAAVSAMGFAPELGIGLSLVIRIRDVLLGAIGIAWGGHALVGARQAGAGVEKPYGVFRQNRGNVRFT